LASAAAGAVSGCDSDSASSKTAPSRLTTSPSPAKRSARCTTRWRGGQGDGFLDHLRPGLRAGRYRRGCRLRARSQRPPIAAL